VGQRQSSHIIECQWYGRIYYTEEGEGARESTLYHDMCTHPEPFAQVMPVAGDDGQGSPAANRIAVDEGQALNGRRRRRRALVTQGSLFVVCVLACRSGWWQSLCRPLDIGIQDDDAACVGIVCARWKFYSLADALAHPEAVFFKQASVGSRGSMYGYLAYVIDSRASCEPMLIEDESPRSLQELFRGVECEGRTFAEIIALWRVEGAQRGTVNIRLAPRLACEVVAGHRTILHIVPLTLRSQRCRFLKNQPTKKHVSALRQSVGHQPITRVRHKLRLAADRIETVGNAVPADEVVDWLDASQNEKQIKRMPSSLLAWAKVLARTARETSADMLLRTRSVNVELVRLARVRLDCVAMLAFRHYWDSLSVDDLSINVWSDASPQWRGVELFASSFDLILPCGVIRRRFPFVQASFGFDATSKVLTLLWQIFLVAGPDFMSVRRFCNSIHSICTDMGVERLMSDHIDCLKEFYWLLNPSLNFDHLPDEQYLFPNCLHNGGWRHLWDNILRRGLVRLPWFADWLLHFKASAQHMEAYCC
jgi:hypothetical protein